MITSKNTKAEILAAYKELLAKQENDAQKSDAEKNSNQEKEGLVFDELVTYIETLKDSTLKRDVLNFFKKAQEAVKIINVPLSETHKGRLYQLYRNVASVYDQLSLDDIPGSINTLEPILHVFSDEPFYDVMVSVFWEIHDNIMKLYPPAREVKFSDDLSASAICALILQLDEEEVKKLNVLAHTQKPIFNRIHGAIED